MKLCKKTSLPREVWAALLGTAAIRPSALQRLAALSAERADLLFMKPKELKECAGLKEEEAESLLTVPRVAGRWQEKLAIWEEKGIRMILFSDGDYPEAFETISDPPLCVFVRGELPKKEEMTVAVVGSRTCTPYGRNQTISIARQLAEAEISIVSGLAYGIDRAAHEGALQAKDGKTYAVLGCGVDMCYPRENRKLFEEIPCHGGLISEFFPETRPEPYHFPRRNRLISGLSRAVAVMEARKKSGSLITAGYALEQGKDVFALPGRLGDPLSEGCLELIRDGAGILLGAEDLLFSLSGAESTLPFAGRLGEKRNLPLAEPENTVYHSVGLSPKYVDEIILSSGLPYPQVVTALLSLELKGLVTQSDGNYYTRNA